MGQKMLNEAWNSVDAQTKKKAAGVGFFVIGGGVLAGPPGALAGAVVGAAVGGADMLWGSGSGNSSQTIESSSRQGRVSKRSR